MRYILDMVHHNPGEPATKTRFLDPVHLSRCGFNGQVFKHINCIATFAASGADCFPAGSPERAWLDGFTPGIEREIKAAKACGLMVFHHIDLFVLPKRLVERFRDEICDPVTGRILPDRPKTFELHRLLFAELAERFPQVDGYIVRVGETYLFDTPHHVGNGPIPAIGPSWAPDYLYRETLAGRPPAEPRWSQAQTDAYVKLIDFLREEICVRHGKRLFFRTWDIFPDKLHASLDHYLDVTDRIEPHPMLAFSIKHTALDFWRRVKPNECLARGRHPQIVEVQCQREYEGKGAFPNYVMHGVIDGFPENKEPRGLCDLVDHPSILGIYSWSRGGGWYGPYIENELWPDLNAYVLGHYAADPTAGEEGVFRRYATERLCLTPADADRFRRLCLLSAEAIVKGRYCEAFDRLLEESVLPTSNWMRDDRLGGLGQLGMVFETLATCGRLEEAIAEKAESVAIWREIRSLAEEIAWPDPATGSFVRLSAEYGRLLFGIVHAGWRVLAVGLAWDRSGVSDRAEMTEALTAYRLLWEEYRKLGREPGCPSLYRGEYFDMPGNPPVPGLDESIARYERKLEES